MAASKEPIAITEAKLRELTANALPDGVARERFYDRHEPGFGIVVGRRGISFFVRHRVAGEQVDYQLGTWGRPDETGATFTAERARKKARLALGQMAAGIDPRRQRATTSEGPTLRRAFEAHIEFLETKIKGGERSEATIETFRKSMTCLERYGLLDEPIAELKREQLKKLYADIQRDAKPRAGTTNEKGAALANRVITNIGTAWATLNDELEGALGNWNPVRRIKVKLDAKEVDVDGLAGWYTSVQTMRNAIQRDGLVFAVFTGLRDADVRSVRFEHVDADEGTLRLPAPKGGAARAFTIPIAKTCLDIIERRKRENERHPLLIAAGGDHGFVFPGLDGKGNVGAIGDLRQQAHEPVLDDEGKPVLDDDGEPTTRHTRIPAQSVHDLRRLFLSVAHHAGIEKIDRMSLANHAYAAADVHEKYISVHLDHLRACVERIEAALWARLKPAPSSAPKRRGVLRAV
jgi:integrase